MLYYCYYIFNHANDVRFALQILEFYTQITRLFIVLSRTKNMVFFLSSYKFFYDHLRTDLRKF